MGRASRTHGGRVRRVAAAVGVLALAAPAPVTAAQNVRFHSEQDRDLRCGVDQVVCGGVGSRVDVRVQKGDDGSRWDEQSEIMLFPFSSEGWFEANSQFAPASQLCTSLSITVTAAGPMPRSGPFRRIPSRLVDVDVVVAGHTATMTGRKCVTFGDDGQMRGSVAVRPRALPLDAHETEIDQVTIKSKTRVYLTRLFFRSSPWATDTIVFDEWTPPLGRQPVDGWPAG